MEKKAVYLSPDSEECETLLDFSILSDSDGGMEEGGEV